MSPTQLPVPMVEGDKLARQWHRLAVTAVWQSSRTLLVCTLSAWAFYCSSVKSCHRSAHMSQGTDTKDSTATEDKCLLVCSPGSPQVPSQATQADKASQPFCSQLLVSFENLGQILSQITQASHMRSRRQDTISPCQG